MKERGSFILITAAIVFSSLALYISVVITANYKFRQKEELNSSILGALTAASNTDFKEYLFKASCGTLKITRFHDLDCESTGTFGDGNEAAASTLQLTAKSFSGEVDKCVVEFSYEPRVSASSQPIKYCLEITCKQNAPILPLSKIDETAAIGCITKPSAVAMVSVDMSSSLVNTYLQPAFPVTPPIPYVYESLVSQWGATTDYTQQYENLSWSVNQFQNELYNLLPVGLRNYYDPTTLKLRTGIAPDQLDDLPFSQKEFDLAGSLSNQDYLQLATQYSGQYPMCAQINISGPDGSLDPMQFTAGLPLAISQAGVPRYIDRLTRDWMSGRTNPASGMTNWFLDGAQDVEGIFTRGGDVSRYYATQMCFGTFVTTYKRAALQALYVLGAQQIPTGVTLFSNVLTSLFPLLPLRVFEEGRVDWNVASEQVMGPNPATLAGWGYTAINPSGAGNNGGDYTQLQFANTGAPGNDQLNWTRMQRLVHPMEWCVGEMDRRVSTTVSPPGLGAGALPFSALPNPFDPSMDLVAPPDTDCTVTPFQSYYQPANQLFSSGGQCVDRVSTDYMNWFQGSSPYNATDSHGYTNICGIATATPPPIGIGSLTVPNSSQITAPYRSCNMWQEPWVDTSLGSPSKVNVAVALTGYAPGGHSPTGFGIQLQNNSVPGVGNSIYDLFTAQQYPNRTNNNNTFTAAAVLHAINTLTNDREFGDVDQKLHIIFTDGVPSVDLLDIANDQYDGSCFGGGAACNSWLPLTAPGIDVLPSYSNFGISFNSSLYPYNAPLLQTLHMIHWGRLLGIKYIIVVIPPSVENSVLDRQAFMWALQKPLNTVTLDSAPGAERKFHFCTPNNSGTTSQSDAGSMNPIDPGATCNTPLDLSLIQPADGIGVVYVPTTIGETYEAFQARVLSGVSQSITRLTRRWRLNK